MSDSPPHDAREAATSESNLSNAQMQLWLGQKLAPSLPIYNMILAFDIAGELNVEAFQRGFSRLVATTDALRSVFEEHGALPRRRVLDHIDDSLPVVDFSTDEDPERAYAAWLEHRRALDFDLGERLFDSALVRLGERRHVWYLNQHHLITDGWAKAILYRLMMQWYRFECGNGDAPEPPPRYDDFVDYERAHRASKAFKRAQEHWQRVADALAEPVRFAGTGRFRQGARTERVALDLGAHRSRALKSLAAEPGVRALTQDMSVFNLFASVLFALLHRISGSACIAIGTPAHNRPSAVFKNTLGVFIELFPLHVEFDDEETLASLLKKVMRASGEFLRRAQPGASSAAGHRGFNVVLNYINAAFPAFDGMPTRSEWIHPGYGDGAHGLRVQVHDFDGSGSIALHFDFNTVLFEPEYRVALMDQFLHLMDALIEDREQRIATIAMAAPAERLALLDHAWMAPRCATAAVETIVDVLRERALATPRAPALRLATPGRVAERGLDYGELDEMAGRLAQRLIEKGVRPGALVGISMRRSLELVVAVHAVLRCGAAYVPLDPTYPQARLQFMLEDSGAVLVLCDEAGALAIESAASAGQLSVMDVSIDALANDLDAGLARAAPTAPEPAELAYVIYTSGSSGQPKGTLLSHANLMHYLRWALIAYGNGSALDMPLYSSFSFDLTITSLFLPPMSGGCVVVYCEEAGLADAAVRRVVADDQVDVLKLTPAHLAVLDGGVAGTRRLRALILGGEALRSDLARSVTAARPEVAVYNEYGPTEATVGCMIHRFDAESDHDVTVPIGVPIDGTAIHLLDAALQPVPVGIVGEICISGGGVAHGYLNRKSLTAERFVDDPGRPGVRMYRTGDLARRRPGGCVELLGRADQQVKIRGARVELAELESALLEHDAVTACVADMRLPAHTTASSVVHCARCAIPSSHPDAEIDADGICNLCHDFERYRDAAMAYFKSMDDLRAVLAQARESRRGKYDCVMLLSGGKDSTYVLYQLAELGLVPLVVTLDNGFISEGAKANIARSVDDLGLDHIMARTPSMNAIFVDSLKTFSNVCNGCFKTIYTLSMNIARQHDVSLIVTGLSRGQIFETRIADLFRNGIFDVPQIERTIIEARKAYHRMDDVVSRCLDVEIFRDDAAFEEIQFLDFYRYCDTSLEEILQFLATRAPWVRPSDTGRSTNCLINDVGIHVHTRDRGYHNYALPYSWDVRLGHKTREAALKELSDELDEDKVTRILSEIGYAREAEPADARQLVMYYVSDRALRFEELRQWLAQRLPEFMLPARFYAVNGIALTANGKVDRAALGAGAVRTEPSVAYVAPCTGLERRIAEIWQQVLGLERVGVEDDFLKLGGDSILGIQVVSRANRAGIGITAKQMFEQPSVRALAAVARESTEASADQEALEGETPLSPVQIAFFERGAAQPEQWTQSISLQATQCVEPETLERALAAVVRHHDALRLVFELRGSRWHARFAPPAQCFELRRYDFSSLSRPERARRIEQSLQALHTGIDLGGGVLLSAALLDFGTDEPARLELVAHHLAVDVVSWFSLVDDLDHAYCQLRAGSVLTLPMKTGSYRQWARALEDAAASPAFLAEEGYWRRQLKQPASTEMARAGSVHADVRAIRVELDAKDSEALAAALAGSFKASSQEALLCAAAMAIGAWRGDSSVCVQMESHGREPIAGAPELARSVGNFTAEYPLRIPLVRGGTSQSDLAGTLKQVKETLRGVPGHGVGFGVLRHLARLPALSGNEPTVLFNYLGHLQDTSSKRQVLRFRGDMQRRYGPRNPFAYDLDVSAWFARGRLVMEWRYSERRHEGADVLAVAQSALATINALAAGAHGGAAASYTPSDFPQAQIDQHELEQILDEFREP